MLIKLDKAITYGRQRGGFGIEIRYPGLAFPDAGDTGVGGIGRIDHATVEPGTLIPMHPHKNDEILTYLRTGKVAHLDSEGVTETLSNGKLMMMNAGARFYHEESVLDEGGTLEGLQIFIRPDKGGLVPRVQFYDLAEPFSTNQWRKLAGRGEDYPLAIRSDTWIFDIRIMEGNKQTLPEMPMEDPLCLLYVFHGALKTDRDILLKTGESLLMEKEKVVFTALETTDVVLFITDKHGVFYGDGMYSGNQKRLTS